MPPKKTDYHASKSIQIGRQINGMYQELPTLVCDYLRSIAVSATALTRLNYAYDLRLFLRFLTSECPDFADTAPSCFTAAHFGKVSLRELEFYQDYLRQYVKSEDDDSLDQEVIIQNHEIGIARKLSSLRSFYKYLYRRGEISENITEKITMPKIHEKPIIYLNREEISRLIDTVQTGEGLTAHQKAFNKNTRTRDLAIIFLLAGTGIRCSELIGLDLDDIDLKNQEFMVTRKGGNQAILFFNTQVRDALQDYLVLRREIDPVPGNENALFLSSQRKRICPRALENLVKKYASVAAPLKRKLSPHKLRSTFGTNLYQNTGDIYLVATALGHKNIDTTRKHYAAVDEKERRTAAQAVDWIPDERQNS